MDLTEFLRRVRDHGVGACDVPALDEHFLDALYEGWRNFFESDEATLFRAPAGALNGYFPWLAERAVGADQPDSKEFFHVMRGHPVPSSVAGLTWAAFETLRNAAGICLSALDASLGRGGILSRMLADDCRVVLRIAHYRSPTAGAQPFAAPHTDIDLLTLLPPATDSGLQVRSRSGDWMDVIVPPGRAIVFVGDMLAEATGGELPSTVHRVATCRGGKLSLSLFANPPDKTRLSVQRSAGELFRLRLREMGNDHA